MRKSMALYFSKAFLTIFKVPSLMMPPSLTRLVRLSIAVVSSDSSPAMMVLAICSVNACPYCLILPT